MEKMTKEELLKAIKKAKEHKAGCETDRQGMEAHGN